MPILFSWYAVNAWKVKNFARDNPNSAFPFYESLTQFECEIVQRRLVRSFGALVMRVKF